MKINAHRFLALMLVVSLVLPAFALSEASDDDIEAMISSMTLEEKVGQMMVVSFRVWKEIPEAGSETNDTVENAEEQIPEVNITELNDPIRECLGTITSAVRCCSRRTVRTPNRWCAS